MDNKRIWNRVCRPPEKVLKPIQAGRLKGKSDINPQWRYEAMTEIFGPVGFGWYHTIDEMMVSHGEKGEQVATVVVSLYVKEGDEWSEPIQGIGGSMLVAQEKNGPFTSDEAFKMAETDALSVAMKRLGVAADIYKGDFDGSKYSRPVESGTVLSKPAEPKKVVTAEEQKAIDEEADKLEITIREILENNPDPIGTIKAEGFQQKMNRLKVLDHDRWQVVADFANQVWLDAKEQMEGRG